MYRFALSGTHLALCNGSDLTNDIQGARHVDTGVGPNFLSVFLRGDLDGNRNTEGQSSNRGR